jgi:hypothetical protein
MYREVAEFKIFGFCLERLKESTRETSHTTNDVQRKGETSASRFQVRT